MTAGTTEPLTGQVAIALGSNLGDSMAILNSAIESLNHSPGITVTARSPWYLTKAIGPPQPDFINGCALLHTTLTPAHLLHTLLAIEQQFGRVRAERWGPRILDLDLLLFDDVILHTPTLQIPHPHLTHRAFVLVPLAEIAPAWIEPITQKAIADLVQVVDCSEVRQLQ